MSQHKAALSAKKRRRKAEQRRREAIEQERLARLAQRIGTAIRSTLYAPCISERIFPVVPYGDIKTNAEMEAEAERLVRSLAR
jgi:hypothetical protein